MTRSDCVSRGPLAFGAAAKKCTGDHVHCPRPEKTQLQRIVSAWQDVRRIYAKLHVNTLGGAVVRAIRDGIV